MLSSTILTATFLVPSMSVPSRSSDVMTCRVIAMEFSFSFEGTGRVAKFHDLRRRSRWPSARTYTEPDAADSPAYERNRRSDGYGGEGDVSLIVDLASRRPPISAAQIAREARRPDGSATPRTAI